MPGDPTYQAGIYRTQGGNKIVVDRNGSISSSTTGPGSVPASPTGGALGAHTTSATLVGNDFAGTIVLVGDGVGTAANVSMCTVTFGTAKTTAPIVILTNLTAGPADATHYAGLWSAVPSTTGFTILPNITVPATVTTTVGYLVISVE